MAFNALKNDLTKKLNNLSQKSFYKIISKNDHMNWKKYKISDDEINKQIKIFEHYMKTFNPKETKVDYAAYNQSFLFHNKLLTEMSMNLIFKDRI